MSHDQTAPTTWYAAFDTLRRAQPQVATALASAFPEFGDEILGRRVFGVPSGEASTHDRHTLSRAAVEAVCSSVTQSLDEVLTMTRRRARLLARTRLGAGLLAVLCSAGVLAALSQNAISTTAISAIVATLAAALNLLATYYEEQSGGEGSVTRLREMLIDQVSALAEVKGKLALGLLTRKDDSVISVMTALNAISARLQIARARLGLPL